MVRRALYLREEVRIAGRACETKETLQDLVSWLDVSLRLRQMDQLWQAITNVVSATFAARVKEYEDLCEPLERGLGLHKKKSDLQDVLKGLAAVPEPTWHDLETVRDFCGALQAAEAEIALRAIEAQFKEITGPLEALVRLQTVDPNLGGLIGRSRPAPVPSSRPAETRSSDDPTSDPRPTGQDPRRAWVQRT